MNILDLLPGQYKRAGHKNGGELAGACPWCGGRDRFHVWPEQGRNGTYWCRRCGKGGDAIRYLMDHDGLDFKAAITRLDLSAEEVLGPKKDKIPTGWQPQAASNPAEIWAAHALKFVDWCHARLLERPIEMQWLADRGIGIEMVVKYRLGWNPEHAWRERPAWGLDPEKKTDGKQKKLWLPRGLVIPMIDDGGRVLRLRIRQPDQSPRYLVIPGSSREPLCSRAAEAMFIVESELDAITLDGLAGELIGVVAMGNDSAKPTDRLHLIVQTALFIGVALDSDLPRYNPETGRMEMPGAKSSQWWLKQYPQAVRVPMIGGKDPGEAYKDGVNLPLWVYAALPPYFHVKADLDAEKQRRAEQKNQSADVQVSEEPEKASPGEADQPAISPVYPPAEPQDVAQMRQDIEDSRQIEEKLLDFKTVTLKNGRSFCLTADRDTWEKLTEQGNIVFSEYELKRLQTACQGMSQDDRLAAAMQVLDLKEIFPTAWIKRGEQLPAETSGI